MKILKNKTIFTLLSFLLIISTLIPFNNRVYANDDKLDTFIATSIDRGYLNSAIEITQVSKHKYDVVFLVKENILGINYGFYLTPSIVESLTKMGFECETVIDEQYAYNMFKIRTNNLSDILTRLSVLPYIDFEYYIDEESKEQILKGNFQDDFFKEERASNEMLNTLFESNMTTLRFKPMSEQLFMSNAPLKDDYGFYVWVYSKDTPNTDFSAIIRPMPVYVYVIVYMILLLVICLLVFLVVFIIKKYRGNKSFNGHAQNNGYDDYNYNGYNDYNNYDDY